MPNYENLTQEELEETYTKCKDRYNQYKQRGLKLDMSRGKPGADQLDLSVGLLGEMSDYKAEDGTDCRNYGGIDGIPEIKRLFADLMEVRTDEVLAGGNASLTLMFESAMIFTADKANRKYLCPSPGYDRHFAIAEHLGVEMIPIPMTSKGPDMAEIKKHITDPAVAGLWCVPVYSNPQGIVYSDETVRELAALKPAAADFRIIWDNAYMVHTIDGDAAKVPCLLRECENCGNYDMALMFTSFSKVTFPGAGVVAMAASPANLAKVKKHLGIQTIGPDKINQLRHARFFKDVESIHQHMKKHADILRPKFNIVFDELAANLKGKGIGTWLIPKGGYFVAFDTLPGCAKRTIALCADAGLIMTPAGATFPYGHDPEDKNIRIAPTFPPPGQLKQAMELFCAAVELAALEKILGADIRRVKT